MSCYLVTKLPPKLLQQLLLNSKAAAKLPPNQGSKKLVIWVIYHRTSTRPSVQRGPLSQYSNQIQYIIWRKILHNELFYVQWTLQLYNLILCIVQKAHKMVFLFLSFPSNVQFSKYCIKNLWLNPIVCRLYTIYKFCKYLGTKTFLLYSGHFHCALLFNVLFSKLSKSCLLNPSLAENLQVQKYVVKPYPGLIDHWLYICQYVCKMTFFLSSRHWIFPL